MNEDDRRSSGATGRPPKRKASRRGHRYSTWKPTWTEFIDKDRARNHAYYLTVLGAEGDKVPPRIVAAGRSFNHLERVNGKGLIKLRDVSPQE